MKKLFQAGLGQFLGGAAAPQHLQTNRPCLRRVQNQSTDLFYDEFAEIAKSKMFMKHD